MVKITGLFVRLIESRTTDNGMQAHKDETFNQAE